MNKKIEKVAIVGGMTIFPFYFRFSIF